MALPFFLRETKNKGRSSNSPFVSPFSAPNPFYNRRLSLPYAHT